MASPVFVKFIVAFVESKLVLPSASLAVKLTIKVVLTEPSFSAPPIWLLLNTLIIVGEFPPPATLIFISTHLEASPVILALN